MKVLKKIGKVMAVLFLVLMLGLAALDIYPTSREDSHLYRR